MADTGETRLPALVIGLMSGTSLDGLDIAAVVLRESSSGKAVAAGASTTSESRADSHAAPPALDFELVASACVPYNQEWMNRLGTLHEASAAEYVRADAQLGALMGTAVRNFVIEHVEVLERATPTGALLAVGSHGHTVFHAPDEAVTTQIGSLSHLAAAARADAADADHGGDTAPNDAVNGGGDDRVARATAMLKRAAVVGDFRTLDVAWGGQGAPLVPIGDALLFGAFDACLNLGGIANVSVARRGVAFDICPCNMALNYLARKVGCEYDQDGDRARAAAEADPGGIDDALLTALNADPFFDLPAPKSLGREFCDASVFGMLDVAVGGGDEVNEAAVASVLATYVAHVAGQIGAAVAPFQDDISTLLVSGGGARNAYLMEVLRARLADAGIEVHTPGADTVDFKEAIVFGLLAWLRLSRLPTTLASVTGAPRDLCTGVVVAPEHVA